MHAQTGKLIARISENLPDISVQGWIENPLGLKKALLVLCLPEEVGGQKAVRDTDRPSYELLVNYNQTLEEMIAAGHYDWWNNDITAERFPISGVGLMLYEPKLFHFGQDISFNEAERRIKANDLNNLWEPAKIEHTLAYGATFPDNQRQFPIVGLGSVALLNGLRSVVYLYRHGSSRNLVLSHRASDWDGYYRFLAVRKIQNSGS